MPRKALTGMVGLVATMTLLLSGCSSSPPDDVQLEAWSAAVLAGVPNAVAARAQGGGEGDWVILDVTLRDGFPLTYDDMKQTHESLVASTNEKWQDTAIFVHFNHADGLDAWDAVDAAFADAGVGVADAEKWSRPLDLGGDITLRVHVEPDGPEFPPATLVTVGGVDVAIEDAEKLQTLLDAAQASDPGIASISVHEASRVTAEAVLRYPDGPTPPPDESDPSSGFSYRNSRAFVFLDVTLHEDAPLTYSLMESIYDAVSDSTPDEWFGAEVMVYFHPTGSSEWLRVKDVFVAAGVSDPSVDGVYGEAYALILFLNPEGGGFPQPDGESE